MTSEALPAGAHGFVRFPRHWLTLPVSPAAKALLLQFCAAANGQGESWYSYEDLGAIIGRSKASVSAYVGELTQAGILGVIRQRTANGFNYRLKIRILDWAPITETWKRSVRPGPRQPNADTERRVRPVERKDPSGQIKIQENHHLRARPAEASDPWTAEDEAQWRAFRPNDSDPVSSFSERPRRAILEKLLMIAEDGPDPRARALDATSCQAALTEFAEKRSCPCGGDELRELAASLVSKLRSEARLHSFIEHLDRIWKPHWRRMPTPWQAKKVAETLPAQEPTAEDRRRSRLQSRALVARLALRTGRYRENTGRRTGQETGKNALPASIQDDINLLIRKVKNEPLRAAANRTSNRHESCISPLVFAAE